MATHIPTAGLEFCALAERVGIAADAAVAPRTAFTYGIATRDCGVCAARRACRDALQKPASKVADFIPFCPNIDLLHELMYRSLMRAAPSAPMRSPRETAYMVPHDQVGTSTKPQ